MKKLLLLVLVAVTSLLFSETIILNDGKEFEAQIVGKKGNNLFVITNEDQLQLNRKEIKTIKNSVGVGIVKKTFNKKDWGNTDSNSFKMSEASKKEADLTLNDNLKQYKAKFELDIKPIPFMSGIALVYLAYDCFATSGEIQDSIDKIEKINLELPGDQEDSTSSLESQKSRKIVGGVLLSVASVVNLYLSVDMVEITATDNTIGLSYNF